MTCLRVRRAAKQNLLLILTLVGVALGLGIGFAIRGASPSEDVLMWLGMPGELYLRLLKMMIVPLIVTSVVSGTASLGPQTNGKIGVVAFVFIVLTNMLGAILGVLAFVAFKPGNVSGKDVEEVALGKTADTQDIFADLLRNIIPDNLFEATFRQTLTTYNEETAGNVTTYVREVGKTSGPNLLGLITACSLLGSAAASLGGKGQALVDFCEASTHVVIVVIRWFLWTTPLGVLSLILKAVADISDTSTIFRDLGMFIAAVVVAIAVQQLVAMPLVLFGLTRRNPYRHMLEITRPWLIGFAAASTAVAIPEMLQACEERLRADRRVVRFVIPFSVTLSANGSATFIACSCLFIANFSGQYPTVGTILIVGILSTVASLAIPSVPSASIVTIVMILTSLNVSIEPIALLLAVEFLLDRLRTTSSVVSHTMCAVVTHHFSKNSMMSLPVAGDDVKDIPITDVVEAIQDMNSVVVDVKTERL